MYNDILSCSHLYKLSDVMIKVNYFLKILTILLIRLRILLNLSTHYI